MRQNGEPRNNLTHIRSTGLQHKYPKKSMGKGENSLVH